MGNVLDMLNPYRWLLLAALAAGAWWGFNHWQESLREEGREEVRQEMMAAALREHETKAKESLRRVTRQEENQRAQDQELARARADADRAAAAADSVRQQATDAAREWSARLADSPSGEDLAAAGAAIRMCVDVRGRLVDRAQVLAAHADAARAAGLKCERDYDALRQ